MKMIDITGQRSGNLTAMCEADPWILPDGRKQRMYKCKCDCGNECVVRLNDFRSGRSTSCGCKRNKSNHDRMFEDLTGQTFGRLTVIERSDDFITSSGEKKVQWKCRCSCGNIIFAQSYSLKNGNTQSCGCLKSENVHKRCFKDLTGQAFGHLRVVRFDYMNGKHSIYECLCDCGTTCYVSANKLRRGITKSCGHICSRMEDAVNSFLLTNKYEYQYHVVFKDLKNNGYLEFDFAIKQQGRIICLIECQGRQHFDDVGSFGKLQREVTDEVKREYCANKHIPLKTINYNEDPIEKIKIILDDLHANPVPSLVNEEGATTISEESS